MKRKLRQVRGMGRGCMLMLGIACMAGFGACGMGKTADGNADDAVWAQSVDTAMGTIVTQRLDAGDRGEEFTEQIIKEITDLEEDTLSWRLESAEIYRINHGAGAAVSKADSGTDFTVEVSEELGEILEICLELAKGSHGALDITIGEVTRLWSIDALAVMEQQDLTGDELPTEKEIAACLEETGYEKLSLKGQQLVMEAGVQLDLGAVGKGVALDRICSFLEQQEEVQGAVISVGGSILTYGEKRSGEPWIVAVTNPFDTSQTIGYLTLQGQWCVSTSGDYERYVEIDGTRYHHIIDPHTGYPADSDVRSVTILTKDGLLSDALSTACFVLGEEAGKRLAQSYGVEALFVDKEGKITMTEGMKDYFQRK